MLLFLLSLMPCALMFYCCAVQNKKIFPVMFIGIMTGVIYCLVRVVGFYSHRLIPDSLSANYVYYLFRYTIIPVFSIYILYILLTRDTWELKFSMFFPLLGTFYAIFIPYKVIAFTAAIYSGYDIFLRPVIYLAMIAQCAICLTNIYNTGKNKNIVLLAVNILILCAYLLVPALLDSMFDLNMNMTLIVVISLGYACIPLVLSVLKLLKLKKMKSE